MRRSQAIAAVVVLAGAAALVLSVGGAAAQTDEVTITITPVDTGGEALGNVDFEATWDGGEISGTTLSKGTYSFDVPAGTNVRIEITDEEYIRNSPYVLSNATTREVKIPVAKSGHATVTVRTGTQPLADATVALEQEGTVITRGKTGQDGTFTTERIEQGDYVVRAVKSTYYENSTSIVVQEDTQEIVQLRRGAVEVKFLVNDDSYDKPRPLSNAVIDFVNRETRLATHEDGTRSTTLSVNQEVKVRVTKDGYQTATETLAISERALTHNISIRRNPKLTLDVLNNRVVVGENTRISVMNEYGEPVPDANVIVDGDRIGNTDENGEATVPIQTEGDLQIEVTKAGLSTSQTVEGVAVDKEETPTATSRESETTTGTMTETATDTATETPGSTGPGFGVVASLLAVLGAILLVRRQ